MKRMVLALLLVSAGLAVAWEPQPQQPPQPPQPAPRAERSAERAYDSGSRYLDKRQWEEAINAFSQVPRDDARADGALYWTAFAQNKLGHRAEAITALGELQKSHPESRWMRDAKALEIEIRQAEGQPVKPEAETDEELKLVAINSLMHSDSERAVPLLEKVLQGSGSPRLKERALFVLLQSSSPSARQIVVDIARGNANPDMQRKAISYLGVFGGQQSRDTLADIYSKVQDAAMKRQILDALFTGHAADKIAAIARSEQDANLRVKAVELLGVSKGTASELAGIYANDSDKRVRKAVMNAYFIQGNAAALVDIARKEADLELKKDAVSKLSIMRSKEATDFMIEILNK